MPCSRTQHGLTRVGLEPLTSGSGVRGINHQATALPSYMGVIPKKIQMITANISGILSLLIFGNFTAHLLHIESCNKKILNFWTDRWGQTLQTQIRPFIVLSSNLGLDYLIFQLHLFDKLPYGLASLFEF